jgi:hypothetical protein
MAAMAALLAMSLASCAAPRSADPAPEGVPTPVETIGSATVDAGPPPFLVRFDDTELRVAPTTWSLDGNADTGAVSDAPSVGDPDVLYVFVPVSGWSTVSAVQYTGSDAFSCDGLAYDAAVEDLGGGWAAVRPTGPSGQYTLELFSASGPGSGMFSPIGEMYGHLRWNVSSGIPVPPATASVSLVADSAGTIEAWDLIVEIVNLDPPTTDISAEVTVTSAEGNSLVLRPEPTDLCVGQAVNLNLPFTETQEVLALGGAPFTYDVRLTIDGVTYNGSATYTTGTNSVPLVFDTPLP